MAATTGARRAAADLLARSQRRLLTMVVVALFAIVGRLVAAVVVGDGLLGDVLAVVTTVAALAIVYGTIRYGVSLLGFDPRRGLVWTISLTILPAGELPTGTGRVRPIRPWLPRAVDNARARMVVAERYPARPTWWQGQRFSYAPLARQAARDERAVVLSTAAGDRVLVGAPGRAGVVLRRIADPQTPEARQRDRMVGIANRTGFAGLGLLAAVVVVDALGIGVGPLDTIAVLLVLAWGLARPALAVLAARADRQAVDLDTLTLGR